MICSLTPRCTCRRCRSRDAGLDGRRTIGRPRRSRCQARRVVSPKLIIPSRAARPAGRRSRRSVFHGHSTPRRGPGGGRRASTTRVMPATSWPAGTWPSTTSAAHGGDHRQQRQHQGVRGAGQPGHRHWSATYGITVEHTPTPTPPAASAGWPNAGSAPADPERRRDHRRDRPWPTPAGRPRRGRPSIWRSGGRARRTGRSRAQFAKAKANPAGCPATHLGEQGDAGARRGRARSVAPGPRAVRRERDTPRNSMLADRRQRERGRGRGRTRRSSRPGPRRGRASCAARPAGAARSTVHGRRQTREHDGRGGQPQPGHPEHVDVGEQQHRERRAQVVEAAPSRTAPSAEGCARPGRGWRGGTGSETSAGHGLHPREADRRSEGLIAGVGA